MKKQDILDYWRMKMAKLETIKRQKVFIVLEHASKGNDACIREVTSTREIAETIADTLRQGSKWGADGAKKKTEKAKGYVSVLEWTVKGPLTKILLDVGTSYGRVLHVK